MNPQPIEAALPLAPVSVVVTSGRWLYLLVHLTSARLAVRGLPSRRLVFDTSVTGMSGGVQFLARIAWGPFELVSLPSQNIRQAMSHIADRADFDLILHLEDDFLFVRRVSVEELVQDLDLRAIGQVFLLRQRWFEAEWEYATFFDYLAHRRGGTVLSDCAVQLSGYFTTNPSLYRHATLSSVSSALRDERVDIELAIGTEFRSLGISALGISGPSGRPLILHYGAVSTTRLRSSDHGMLRTGLLYGSIHTKRQLTVMRRWLVRAAARISR